MTVCDRCNEPLSNLFEDAPTCNRCQILDVLRDTIAANVCRSCEPDDIDATAQAVLAVFDDVDEANRSLIGEWLIQIGWR